MKRSIAITALLLALAPAVSQAQGYPDYGRPTYGARGDQDQARDAVRGGRQVPLSRVIGMIAARTPGRQIDTLMGDYSGRPAYFVVWKTPDGRVMNFIVDAESGQILSREG